MSYFNSRAVTQTMGPTVGSVVASPLVPVSENYAIVVPAGCGGNGSSSQQTDEDLEASMESLLANLSQSVGAALRKELGT